MLLLCGCLPPSKRSDHSPSHWPPVCSLTIPSANHDPGGGSHRPLGHSSTSENTPPFLFNIKREEQSEASLSLCILGSSLQYSRHPKSGITSANTKIYCTVLTSFFTILPRLLARGVTSVLHMHACIIPLSHNCRIIKI